MSNVENILGIGLGGTSILGLVSYLLYSWSKGNCASHLKMGETELRIDINQLKDVIESVDSPEERAQIKKELHEEMQKTLHRVKSKLTNRLQAVREARGTRSVADQV